MQSSQHVMSQSKPAEHTSAHLERGDMIGGRFEVSQLTRHDFVGTVYNALDIQSQRDVECLLINLQAEDTPQLLELRAHIHEVKKLKLKSFASTYGIGKQGADGYLVRQRIEGRPLTDHLNHRSQNHRPFKQRGLCSLLIEMIQALEALETQELDMSSHGVIRPNIVMIQNQSKPRVRLTDLGLGSLRSALVKNREADPWTRGCIPELRNEAAPQNPDLYALGALLFQMTQLRPFTKGWLRELSVSPTFSQLPDLIEACTAADPLITLSDLKSELKYAAQSQVESGGLTRDLSQLQERLQQIIHYEPTPTGARLSADRETLELPNVGEQIKVLTPEEAESIAAEQSVSIVFDSLPIEGESYELENEAPLLLTPVPTSAYMPQEDKPRERKANLLNAPAAIEPQTTDHPEHAESEPIPYLQEYSPQDESPISVDMSAMNEMFEKSVSEAEQPISTSADLGQLDFKIETLHGVELEDLDESEGELFAEFTSSREALLESGSMPSPPTPPASPSSTPTGEKHTQRKIQSGSQATAFEIEGLPLIPPPAAPSLPYDDDLSGQRWIVVRDGVDYGPYTLDELSHQLFREEIDLETEICDIESDERAALGEFASLERVLNEWAKERLIRRQQKIELERRAKVRRRYTLIALIASVGIMIFAGVSYGPQLRAAMLPTPVNVDLNTWINPPVEMKVLDKLKENPAKVAERERLRRAHKARLETLKDAKAMAREAREASEASTVDFNTRGAKLESFSRAEFDQAIATRSAKLLQCIEAEHLRAPEREVIKVTMTVQRSGRFLNARLVDGTGPGVKCVFRAIQGLKMSPFSGGDKTITLPYKVK